MDRIEVGSAATELQLGNDGILEASFRGLVLPSNLQAVSLPVLQVAAACGARGLLYRGTQAAVCFDVTSAVAMYALMGPVQRALPLAFVASPGQAELYLQVARCAGAQGLLRGVFFSEFAARRWLARNLQLLAANQAWWAQRG